MTSTVPASTVPSSAAAPDLAGTAFRASPSAARLRADLGLLAELPGHWVGHGFNLIARPNQQTTFFLELNPTKETLDFTPIGGAIPNRGSEQPDVNLHGLHYLQQVSDRRSDTGIHIEPGLWIRVPRTSVPHVDTETYVRQATVPHGDSLLAQSTSAFEIGGPPTIAPVDSFPFTGNAVGLNDTPAHPETNQAYLRPYLHRSLPPHITPERHDANVIKNPALFLVDDLRGLTISKTVVLEISTEPVGGIVNIPFVVRNANATRLDATFWIETVQDPHVGEIMQLQYLQRVILDFSGIKWPHVSVATLRKQ